MDDQERFDRVAKKLKNRLNEAGLRTLEIRPQYEEWLDGWWAKVASWPKRDRPDVGIWLHRIPTLGEARWFWFGFYSSSKNKVEQVSTDISSEHPIVTTTKADFESRLSEATANDRVVYEDWEDEDHIGKYDFNLGKPL